MTRSPPPHRLSPFAPRQAQVARFAWTCIAIAVGLLSARESAWAEELRPLVLEPERWPGERFPLLDEIDIGDTLRTGSWTVVLSRHDCPACAEFEEKLLKELDAPEDAVALAFIELPPYGPRPASEGPVLRGRLSEACDWVLGTPLVLTLKDGRVSDVKELGRSREVPEPSPGSRPGPEDEFSAKSKDLGFVEPGSVHRIEFRVDGSTSEATVIRNVISECACTLVKEAPKSVAAGARERVVVEFVAPKEPMVYSKRVVLLTDSETSPRLEFTLRARIGLPLTLQPAALEVDDSTGEETSVTVQNDGPEAVKLLYATANVPAAFARIPREVIPPKGSLRVPISLRRGVLREKTAVVVSLRTTSLTQPSLQVRIGYRAGSAKKTADENQEAP